MINKDFFSALDELEREKKIDKNLFIESLEAGLVAAYKKQTGETRPITVKLNETRNVIKVYSYRIVVDEVVDEDKDITLIDALAIKNSYKLGDWVLEDVTPKDFSRIAAQTAKQVIMQKLNDAHKDRVLKEMNEKEGEVMMATVRRVEGDNVYVEMAGSQLEGVMMGNDKIRSEEYRPGDRISVYIKSIRSMGRITQVLVSRSVAGFVKRLLEREVPELKSGLIVVKCMARDAGARTKIAVMKNPDNKGYSIDPVGACVGVKRTRINSVIQELNGEKIDIIDADCDIKDFITRALEPATLRAIKIDEEEKKATVVVNDDKLSLAIGKGGQNVRLAAKLTGYKIDVKSMSQLSDVLNQTSLNDSDEE